MPYHERLKDAFYTSPSGKVTNFDFERLQRTTNHRVGTFEFPGVNGTLHQDKGVSGELYPLTIFIHGQGYDLEADRFWDITKERGPGFLNHPRWGKKRVQIIGAPSQNENLTESAGQAVFEITFQETLERQFPNTNTASQQQISSLADSAQADAIDNYTDQIDVEKIEDREAQEQSMTNATNAVDSALAAITSSDQDIAATFRGYIDNILNNVNDLVDEPLTYATQITSAVRVVAEVPGRISAKTQGYQNLLDAINLTETLSPTTQNKNSILNDELVGTMAIVSSSESINQALNETSTVSRDSNGKATITVPNVETGFQTREEVLSSVFLLETNANALIERLDEGQVIFEDSILSESYIQTVQSYVPTWLVVSAVIKAGLDLSFSLPIKRTKILPRSETILTLCYDFYKNVDDIVLDYFIFTNCLINNEIIEVPRGKEVIYYE